MALLLPLDPGPAHGHGAGGRGAALRTRAGPPDTPAAGWRGRGGESSWAGRTLLWWQQ